MYSVDEGMINDTVRQLKNKLTCYVFNEEQLKMVVEKYKQQTGFDLEIKRSKDIITIRPLKRFEKNIYN